MIPYIQGVPEKSVFLRNTPLRSQSRQLTDVISIQISRPDLLSIQITFQIPNYFQITFKSLSNHFQITFKLLSNYFQITFKLLMRLGMNIKLQRAIAAARASA